MNNNLSTLFEDYFFTINEKIMKIYLILKQDIKNSI